MSSSTGKFEFKALFEIVRPFNCLFGALTPVIAVLTTNRYYGLAMPLEQLLRLSVMGYLVYFFVAGAGNVVNDIYDIEVDRVNRPHRVLPRGAMTIKQAKQYTMILGFCAVVLAFSISIQSGLVVLAFLGIGFIYASKAKVAGVIGNFAVAISFSFGMVYGGFYTSPTGVVAPVIWFYFFTAATLLAGREVIKGMEDVEGDALRSVKTIARVYGLKLAASVAIVLNTIGIFFFTAVWVLGWAGFFYVFLMVPADIAVAASSLVLLKNYRDPKNQAHASKMDKIGAFLGLICFLVGAF